MSWVLCQLQFITCNSSWANLLSLFKIKQRLNKQLLNNSFKRSKQIKRLNESTDSRPTTSSGKEFQVETLLKLKNLSLFSKDLGTWASLSLCSLVCTWEAYAKRSSGWIQHLSWKIFQYLIKLPLSTLYRIKIQFWQSIRIGHPI